MLELINSLKTGHAEIDDDHARIIDAINAIVRAINAGETMASSQPLLDHLVNTCDQHHHNEERILAEAGYPDLAAHREGHVQLLEKVRQAREDCIGTDDPRVHTKALERIIDLLIDEIVRRDTAYVSHLQTQGLAPERP